MFNEKLPLTTIFFYQNGSGYARIFAPDLILLATASCDDGNLFLKSEYFCFSFNNVSWLSQFYVQLWTECVFQYLAYWLVCFQYGFLCRQEMLLLLT